jgi:hypothetical protein
MRLIYVTLFGLFFASSCTSNETSTDESEQKDKVELKTIDTKKEGSSVLPKIAHQWILVNRSNTKKDKNVDYSAVAPSIITQFETNGFFSIFDLIEIENEKGKSQTLKARSSGQWEVHNENELVMHHSFNDSAKIESFIIEKLDQEQLVIKNSEKDIIDTYQRKD